MSRMHHAVAIKMLGLATVMGLVWPQVSGSQSSGSDSYQATVSGKFIKCSSGAAVDIKLNPIIEIRHDPSLKKSYFDISYTVNVIHADYGVTGEFGLKLMYLGASEDLHSDVQPFSVMTQNGNSDSGIIYFRAPLMQYGVCSSDHKCGSFVSVRVENASCD